MFLSFDLCNAHARSWYSTRSPPPKAKPPSLSTGRYGGRPRSLRLGFRGSTPVSQGVWERFNEVETSKDLGLVGLSWLVGASLVSVRLPFAATGMPEPRRGDRMETSGLQEGRIEPFVHGFRTLCRICSSGTAQRELRPPAAAGGRQGGGAFGPVGFLDLPLQRGSRKEHEMDEIGEISRDGRMTSGWAATSPYVRLLRCIYLMQRLCLKRGDLLGPRRISGLQAGLPVSRRRRAPVRPLRSCNCFLSLMAFLQIVRSVPVRR